MKGHLAVRDLTKARSRYTRTVGLTQRSVSIVVLAVLTALPVWGAACGILCNSAATASASSHHGSDKECEEPAGPSSEVQIQGVSEHDCGTHDAVVRQASTTAGERSVGVSSPPPAVPAVHATVHALPALETSFAQGAPPGTAPPTTTPLVLRV